jgi:YD repeat-containing protein
MLAAPASARDAEGKDPQGGHDPAVRTRERFFGQSCEHSPGFTATRGEWAGHDAMDGTGVMAAACSGPGMGWGDRRPEPVVERIGRCCLAGEGLRMRDQGPAGLRVRDVRARARYAYDVNGDLLSQTDPTGAVTSATYDFMQRQLTGTQVERYPTTSAPLARSCGRCPRRMTATGTWSPPPMRWG